MQGIIRLGSRDLRPKAITRSGCRNSKAELPNAVYAARLFRAHRNLKAIIDKKDPRFLKGQLMPEGLCRGARINTLPDGQVLDKAYSLFAKGLTIHDESSHDHWDVMFQNPGGTYSYAYTLEKRDAHRKRKYRTVDLFDRHYPKLKRNITRALKDYDDYLVLPMYTLLKTYMRVGNETYYRAHGHKGLTTLKKKDIRIEGDRIIFSYLSKGGVPRTIIERFPQGYIDRLRKIMKTLSKDSFVFTSPHGKPLSDQHFKEAFRRYCGKEFYPHIVRSHYATTKAKEFLRSHKKAGKAEVNMLFAEIAEKLGHRKFDRKSGEWKESHSITINYYIQPEILEKVRALI